ncbi:MAG: hypothetical protein K5694_01785 [Bacilli bacterium]|nr:hypothetical protein [Bacilli bacterium]
MKKVASIMCLLAAIFGLFGAGLSVLYGVTLFVLTQEQISETLRQLFPSMSSESLKILTDTYMITKTILGVVLLVTSAFELTASIMGFIARKNGGMNSRAFMISSIVVGALGSTFLLVAGILFLIMDIRSKFTTTKENRHDDNEDSPYDNQNNY